MTDNRIAAVDVTVERGTNRLLDSVSVEAGAGEMVGIVGPNGAGKTTLLRVLAGDILPSPGSSTLLGADVAGASLQRLALLRAYLGPQTVSDISFRVGEVVAMGRHPYRADDTERGSSSEVVAAAMERVDVAHLIDRQMRTLSSGEQQRVGLARAIAQHSPVMLLDEPTSALDIGHQEMVMAVLRQIASSGVTVISVLHDLNLAAAYTDRVVLLDRGRAVAVGTPREVLTSDLLSDAYQQPIQVLDHPFRDCPLVLTGG